MSAHKAEHDYHLVDPSPWPLFGSFSALILVLGGVFFLHDKPAGLPMLFGGLFLVLLCMYVWWKDVIKEAMVDKAHKPVVRTGLRIGMALFIASEVMFFFAFFFAFFKSWLLPVGILDGLWVVKEGFWPPEGIETFDPWTIPLLNTLILLLSGTTVTWAHHALLEGKRQELIRALGYTVLLGLTFTGLQAYEYAHATFGFTQGVYASNFYMATGFHGFHVIVGTLFLAVCYFRARKGHFTPESHLGFEFAAWYWHFVDVVWLFLFAFVYVFAR